MKAVKGNKLNHVKNKKNPFFFPFEIHDSHDLVVAIAPIALQKMLSYTRLWEYEIGWMGHCTKEGNKYCIHDVYLVHQVTNYSRHVILEKGFTELDNYLYTIPNGDSIRTELKVWGHSHGRLNTIPSVEDDKQILRFRDNYSDFVLRCITNKQGSFLFDIFHYDTMEAFYDVPWSLSGINVNESSIKKDILKLVQYRQHTTKKKKKSNIVLTNRKQCLLYPHEINSSYKKTVYGNESKSSNNYRNQSTRWQTR